MLAKATGTYSSSDVDAAVKGSNYPRRVRVRSQVVNRYGETIRDLTSLKLSGSRIGHNATQDIRRFAALEISERTVILDDFATLTIAYTPLVYLQLGEASGNFADSSGNSRTFTTNGTITYSQASLLPGLTSNTGIKPNGSTGYASIPDAAWMDVSSITIALWWNGTGTNQCLVDRDDGGANRFWRLEVDSSGDLAFTITFTSGSPATKTFTATVATINDGKNHFIVASYGDGFVKLEVDGVPILRTAETRTMNTGALAIRVGATNAGTHFSSGTFDEVAIYGRVLSAQEKRNLLQSGKADYSEIDYTIDQVRVFVGLAMSSTANVATDSDWAEYTVATLVPSIPPRKLDETEITRSISAQDRTVILKNAKFASRYTVLAADNYITHVTTIAALANFDTSGWSITTTSLTAPTTIDFNIGSSYLDAINYLLDAIAYKAVRFKGDGNAVLEPKVQPAARTIEDTLTDDTTSQVSVEQAEETDLSKAFNQVVFYRTNPDNATFLVATASNTNWDSPVSVQRMGPNPAPPVQLDSGDSNSLQTNASYSINQYAQIAQRIQFQTFARPFADDEDCYQLNLINASPNLNRQGKFIEESWELPLNIGMDDNVWMSHTLRNAYDIAS